MSPLLMSVMLVGSLIPNDTPGISVSPEDFIDVAIIVTILLGIFAFRERHERKLLGTIIFAIIAVVWLLPVWIVGTAYSEYGGFYFVGTIFSALMTVIMAIIAVIEAIIWKTKTRQTPKLA